MARKYKNLYGFIHTIGDIVILNGAYLIGIALSTNARIIETLGLKVAAETTFVNSLFDQKYLQLWVYLNIIYLLAANFSKSLEIYRNTRFSKVFNNLMQLFFLQVVLAFTYIVIFKDYNNTFKISRFVLMCTFALSTILTTVWRFGFIKIVRFYRARGFNNRKVIVVGAGRSGQSVKRMLNNKMEYGFDFAGFFDDEPDRFPKIRSEIKGNVKDAMDYALKNNIEEIFCTLPNKSHRQIRKLVAFAEENCIRLKIVPDFNRIISNPLSKIEIDHYGMIPIITLRKEPLDNALNRIIKRVFDFGFSMAVFIFILWWLIPIIALIIKIEDPSGPVFFVQERSGERGKSFNVIKFRSMRVNAVANEKQAERDDPRITKIGRFLRKSSLDELPQFINVILGNMSVIGPRPHMLKHTEEYSKIINKFMVRHFVKPGITGWAQVNGFRGETKDKRLMEERVKHDVYYIENWSLFLDIRILFLTIFNMAQGEKNAF
ncbi:MAG: undecaprenyl-phosphate glucose phosphotransferase [Chitinophagales bacterium]